MKSKYQCISFYGPHIPKIINNHYWYLVLGTEPRLQQQQFSKFSITANFFKIQ